MKYLLTSLVCCLFMSLVAQANTWTAQPTPLQVSHQWVLEKNALSTLEPQPSTNSDSSDTTSDSPWLLFPRHQANLFQHQNQLNPEYGLLVEFLPERNEARLYKNLINPDELSPWFYHTTTNQNARRLSGWKDSNLMFVYIQNV